MNLRIILSVVGIVFLLIGIACPVVKTSDDSILYLGAAGYKVDFGRLIFLLVAAGFLIATNRSDLIWYLGIAALVLIGNDLRLTKASIDNYEGDETYKLTWGWGVLFFGAILLLITVILTDIWDYFMPPDDLADEEEESASISEEPTLS